MGRNALKKFQDNCPHPEKAVRPIWEDDILFGMVYYGKRCTQCGKDFYKGPGPLDLGTYK